MSDHLHHTWVIIFSISVVFISGNVLLRNSTIFSKLSHSIISASWLLSKLRATLNITSVPWRKIISRTRDKIFTIKIVYLLLQRAYSLFYYSSRNRKHVKENWSKLVFIFLKTSLTRLTQNVVYSSYVLRIWDMVKGKKETLYICLSIYCLQLLMISWMNSR